MMASRSGLSNAPVSGVGRVGAHLLSLSRLRKPLIALGPGRRNFSNAVRYPRSTPLVSWLQVVFAPADLLAARANAWASTLDLISPSVLLNKGGLIKSSVEAQA